MVPYIGAVAVLFELTMALSSQWSVWRKLAATNFLDQVLHDLRST
jgi:hypothetical protein